MTITDKQLAELERLDSEAAPSEWYVQDGEVFSDDGAPVCRYVDVEDARFIAAARTYIPALVAEVRRLRELAKGASSLRAVTDIAGNSSGLTSEDEQSIRDAEAFWVTVKELADMRDDIPAERRALSAVRRRNGDGADLHDSTADHVTVRRAIKAACGPGEAT